MSVCTLAGSSIRLPRTDRRESPSAAQLLRRRNALWLFGVEVGLHDPALNRVRPHTTAEIARLWDVSTRVVQLGIASAKKLRGLVK
jgi:hypothetical protein